MEEFHNKAKQDSTRLYLQSLKLRKIKEEESLDVPKGLEKLREIITKFTPCGPIEHNTDKAMVEYLFHAVIQENWAKQTRSNCYSLEMTFKEFFEALNRAWYHIVLEEKDIGSSSNATNLNSENSILWESQKMYGMPRGKFNKNNGRNRFQHVKCWNCKQKGHTHRFCPQTERNMTKNVHTALKRNPKKANKILFEICQQMDMSNDKDSDSNSDSAFSSHSESDEDNETSTTNIVEQIYYADTSNKKEKSFDAWDL